MMIFFTFFFLKIIIFFNWSAIQSIKSLAFVHKLVLNNVLLVRPFLLQIMYRLIHTLTYPQTYIPTYKHTYTLALRNKTTNYVKISLVLFSRASVLYCSIMVATFNNLVIMSMPILQSIYIVSWAIKTKLDLINKETVMLLSLLFF